MVRSTFRSLCSTSTCCPVVALDASASDGWAVVLVERGGSPGGRAPAEIRLTRDEALELARLLEAQGFVALARGAPRR